MAITIPTLDELTQQIIGYFRVEFPGKDLSDVSWIGKQARAFALAILQLYQGIDDAAIDAVPSTSTSSLRLDEFAVLFGLPNGAGGYGRKGAIVATGGVGTATYSGAGPFPYTLTSGQMLVDGAGFQYQTTANVVWNSAGSQSATINAVTTGAGGNLGVGAVLTFNPSPPAGVGASVTLTTRLTGGADAESDGALYTRLLDRLQNPPKGGTGPDWRSWALSASGVSTVYLYPRRQGTGTVDVIVTQSGSGTSRRITSATVLASVLDILTSNRLVTVEGTTAATPYMPGAMASDVVCRVIPTTGNEFDWSGTGLAIDTIVDSTHYKLGTLAPSSLKAAITAGSTPRIQWVTAASPLPQQARVSAFADAGGKTTLTLTAAPTVPALVGDPVYPGGNAVTPVAEAVLALVDSLGPSRVSGFADALQTEWQDTLRVDAVIQVAMNATLSDAPVVRDFVTDPTIDGAATNKQAADDGTNPPQLLYLNSVAVTA